MYPFDRDITRPGREARVDQAIGAGADNGCPFCLARKYSRPRLGEELFFLSGLEVGATGKVTALEADFLRNGEFAVSFPWECPNVSTRISPGSSLFLSPELVKVPEWIAPFAIDDLFQIDEVALRVLLHYGNNADARTWPDEAIFAFADHLWLRRLPIELTELEDLMCGTSW